MVVAGGFCVLVIILFLGGCYCNSAKRNQHRTRTTPRNIHNPVYNPQEQQAPPAFNPHLPPPDFTRRAPFPDAPSEFNPYIPPPDFSPRAPPPESIMAPPSYTPWAPSSSYSQNSRGEAKLPTYDEAMQYNN